jgi:hypothetical protein
MSITVVVVRDSEGAPTARETFAAGTRYANRSGELQVFSAAPELIGLYPSGNWLSVYYDEHMQVIRGNDAPPADTGAEAEASLDPSAEPSTEPSTEPSASPIFADVARDLEIDLDSDLSSDEARDGTAVADADDDVAALLDEPVLDEPALDDQGIAEDVAPPTPPVRPSTLPPGMRPVRVGPREMKPPVKKEEPDPRSRFMPVRFGPVSPKPRQTEPPPDPRHRMMKVEIRPKTVRVPRTDEVPAAEDVSEDAVNTDD